MSEPRPEAQAREIVEVWYADARAHKKELIDAVAAALSRAGQGEALLPMLRDLIYDASYLLQYHADDAASLAWRERAKQALDAIDGVRPPERREAPKSDPQAVRNYIAAGGKWPPECCFCLMGGPGFEALDCGCACHNKHAPPEAGERREARIERDGANEYLAAAARREADALRGALRETIGVIEIYWPEQMAGAHAEWRKSRLAAWRALAAPPPAESQ